MNVSSREFGEGSKGIGWRIGDQDEKNSSVENMVVW